MNYPLVDIVVLNYNSGNVLKKCFPSVLKTDYPNINFIVIDNGSKDGSADFVKKIPNVIFISNLKNLGCPAGLNKAIPYLKGSYHAFLNEDIELEPNWLKEIIKVMEENKKIGIAGLRLFNYYNRSLNEYGSTYFSKWFSLAGQLSVDCIDLSKSQKGIIEVPYVGIGMMVTRADLFKKIGGFRGKYFLYWDDVDYCIRTWLLGYKTVIVKNAKGYHMVMASVKRNVSKLKVMYYARRNSLAFFLIFYSLKEMKKYLITVFGIRLAMIINGIFKKSFKEAISMILGFIGIIPLISWIIKERIILKAYPKHKSLSDIASISYLDPYLSRNSKLMRFIKKYFIKVENNEKR